MSRTQEISKAWSDLYPGLWVRMVTPSVVRSGRITKIKGRSMRVDWLDVGEKTVPDAKHYFAAWKMRLWADPENPGPMPEFYLELLDHEPELMTRQKQQDMIATRRKSHTDDELLDVHDVCAIVGLDPKSVRRRLRSGSLEGFRENGTRWRVRREHALDLARKLGR